MKSDKSYILYIEQYNEFNKVKNRIDTILINSKNSNTSDFNKLLLNLSEKINLKRSDKYVPLSNLSIYYPLKNFKKLKK